eukprot:359432-Chlamydomonas_euryale.AAC.1
MTRCKTASGAAGIQNSTSDGPPGSQPVRNHAAPVSLGMMPSAASTSGAMQPMAPSMAQLRGGDGGALAWLGIAPSMPIKAYTVITEGRDSSWQGARPNMDRTELTP